MTAEAFVLFALMVDVLVCSIIAYTLRKEPASDVLITVLTLFIAIPVVLMIVLTNFLK